MKQLTIRNNALAQKFQAAAEQKHTIDDFTREFLSQFLSEETKIAYVKDLKFFFDFLKSGNVSISTPAEIQAYHFRLYRDHLLERNLASATINRRLVCIRSFVKWAIAAKMMDHNPLDVIKLPRVQTEAPTTAFTDEEVVKMLTAPDTTNHKGRLHRLVMVLLFNLGLRRSELVSIKLGDIFEDRGHKVLQIHGKGDKIRYIPINEYVSSEISIYLANFNLEIVPESKPWLTQEDYLLQTEEHNKNVKPIDGSTIYRVIQKYAEKLGIEKAVSPHSCRATVISHLLDTQNAAIRDVADFCGHNNITTTEKYDKRRNVLDKSAAYKVNYEL